MTDPNGRAADDVPTGGPHNPSGGPGPSGAPDSWNVDRTQEIRPEPARPYAAGQGATRPQARTQLPGHPASSAPAGGAPASPHQQPTQGSEPAAAWQASGPGGPGQSGPYGPGGQGGYGGPNGPGGLGGQPPTPSDGGKNHGSRSMGKWLAGLGAVALLAAALSSAGTYALVHNDDSGNGGTVIKADPKDFADAGTINWSATASKVNPSVVSIIVEGSSQSGEGSGVILDTSGNIVTNNHVVAPAGKDGKLSVTLNDNRTYDAKVVGTDPSTDLAVIRVENAPKLTPVKMGDDSKLVVGQPVMAVGNPLGLAGTVTTGIVSALDRPVTTSESSESGDSSSSDTVVTNAIQTSAAINPGNSGGALVNGSGDLIGINSSIASLSSGGASSQSGNIGIGFAIPVTVVKNITSQLISKGKAEHALLGISTTTSQAKSGSATVTAARVESVNDGSGAQKAGLKKGDQIIAIDGEPVPSSNALVAQVRARTVGSTVKLTIIRDGKKQETTVTLGAQSSSQ